MILLLHSLNLSWRSSAFTKFYIHVKRTTSESYAYVNIVFFFGVFKPLNVLNHSFGFRAIQLDIFCVELNSVLSWLISIGIFSFLPLRSDVNNGLFRRTVEEAGWRWSGRISYSPPTKEKMTLVRWVFISYQWFIWVRDPGFRMQIWIQRY